MQTAIGIEACTHQPIVKDHVHVVVEVSGVIVVSIQQVTIVIKVTDIQEVTL